MTVRRNWSTAKGPESTWIARLCLHGWFVCIVVADSVLGSKVFKNSSRLCFFLFAFRFSFFLLALKRRFLRWLRGSENSQRVNLGWHAFWFSFLRFSRGTWPK